MSDSQSPQEPNAPEETAPTPNGDKYIIRVHAIKATARYALDRLEALGIVLDKKHWPVENALSKTFEVRGWATPEQRRTAEYDGTKFLPEPALKMTSGVPRDPAQRDG